MTAEKTSDAPVYHLFIELASQLARRVCLITPARYLFNAGKTPKEWNQKILNDEHFKVVWYKANSTEVFPSVDIMGGVAVMYRDSQQNYGKIGVFTANSELQQIAQCVCRYNAEPFSSIIYGQNKFDLESVYADYPSAKKVIGSEGRERRLTTPIFSQLALFSDEQIEEAYQILGLINSNRCYRWIKKKYIEAHPNLDMYKVVVPKSNGSGAIGSVQNTPLIGEPQIAQPQVGVTQSFLTIGAFDSRSEAEACLKYVKTKFARTMLGILKATLDNPKETWRLVPLQDFTAASDIDWSQSVADIDRQLYAKYGLAANEIEFIEEKVRAME